VAATTIDLRLSRALVPRPFDASRAADLTLAPADEARTGTTAAPVQTWSVARMLLRERLGEPFRCELWISRTENLRIDPSLPPAQQNTMWDDLQSALDDGTREGPGGENDLQSVDDNLDSALGGPWTGVPGAIGDAIGSAVGVATGAANTISNNLNNQGVEQYLLGIPPPTPWQPEVPPKPGVFLNRLYSVLVTRVAQDGSARAGRWVTGLVTEFEDLGVLATGHRVVRLVIEPQLARLSLRTGHRVFERETPMGIVKKLFEEAGIYASSFTTPVLGEVRPYTIQYGETDLELVMRLFSEEGLVPVFEHHLGAEHLELVLPEELAAGSGTLGYGQGQVVETLDSADLPRALDGALSFADGSDAANEEVLWDFGVTRTVAPTAAAVRSLDFSISGPGTDALPTHARAGSAAAEDDATLDAAMVQESQSSLHYFPGRTAFGFDPDAAVQRDVVSPDAEARRELLAARAESRVGRGRTNAVGLSVGQRVTILNGRPIDPAIYDDEVSPFRVPFVLTRLTVLAENDTSAPPLALPPRPAGFAAPAQPLGLEAAVEATPSDVLFLPRRRRAPRVDGVQTAITRASATEWARGHGRVGVDPIGRVRASLQWDRRAPANNEQPLSPPIRLATPWAGHAWGTTFLPRESMELLIAFRDGDPTQPIGLGCLHGFVNPAPRERPHVDFVGADNHLDPEEEKVLGDDERRLHYELDRMKRPVDDRHLNLIRTAIHPTPDDPPAYKTFHELSFDDTPHEERVRVHSAGLLKETATRDQRTWVGRDQMNVVQGRQTEDVGQHATLTVDGCRTKVVTGNEDRDVVGRQDVTVKGHKSLVADAKLTRKVGVGEASDDVHRIGLNEGDGVKRILESRRDRHTTIQGDDIRNVGGDVDVECGGAFELGGMPLTMESTAEGGGELSSGDGDMTLDGGEGEAELVAKGQVHVKADSIELSGATAVRLECGEVSVELTPEEIVLRAPGGVSFFLDGQPAPGDGGEVPASSSSMTMEGAGGGDVILALADHTVPKGEPGGKFEATFRPGTKSGEYLDAEDALEGGPGVKIAPVDSFVIQGGKSAFECRRVEMQRTGGPKHVHRDMTGDEEQLLADIAELKKKIAAQEKKVAEAVRERDRARDEYRAAARERQAVEDQIRADDGIDEDLGEAIDRVEAAERARQKAKRDEKRAQDDYRRAFERGENTDDEEAALDDARDAVKDAEDELTDAEENLEETREEHGGLMDQYAAAREKEQEKGGALTAAQDRVVKEQNELRRLERELGAKQREASALELEGYDEAAE